MTLSFTLHPATVYLLIAAGVLAILGPALAMITGKRLEIGALAIWEIFWAAAAIILLLAIGSML